MSKHTKETTIENKMEGGAYTGRFNGKNGHIKAQHFIELLDFLHENVENFPETETLWPVLDSESLEDRKKKIKGQRKRATKRADKYKPSNLTKPKQAIHLYRADYKKDIISNGGKFDTAEFNEAWKNLDEDTRETYQKQYRKAMEQYEKDYAKAMKQAIHDGEYEAPKPKRPLSGYFMFCNFCRVEGNSILTSDEFDELKSMPIKEASALFKSKYDAVKENEEFISKMNETQETAKAQFQWKMYHWNVERLEGQIRLCTREGKETKYLQKELDEFRENVDFDTETMPEFDLEWLNEFGDAKSSKSGKSKSKSKGKSKSK